MSQADLVTKADFDIKLQNFNKNINSTKKSICLLKLNLKNLKNLMQSILEVKIILMVMAHKII